MRTLSLLRHGKSSWDNPHLCDFERPLNARGNKAIPIIGEYVAQNAILPDLILCSSSRRTRQTLKLLKNTAKLKGEIQFLDELYLITQDHLLQIIKKTSDQYQHIMIIGHNPTFHTLATDLVDKGDLKKVSALSEKYPTGALAVFDFDLPNWQDLKLHSGLLKTFTTPKMLITEKIEAA